MEAHVRQARLLAHPVLIVVEVGKVLARPEARYHPRVALDARQLPQCPRRRPGVAVSSSMSLSLREFGSAAMVCLIVGRRWMASRRE